MQTESRYNRHKQDTRVHVQCWNYIGGGDLWKALGQGGVLGKERERGRGGGGVGLKRNADWRREG